MFDFIKIQYELGKVTAQWVQEQMPKWITQEQAFEILNAPANTILEKQ